MAPLPRDKSATAHLCASSSAETPSRASLNTAFASCECNRGGEMAGSCPSFCVVQATDARDHLGGGARLNRQLRPAVQPFARAKRHDLFDGLPLWSVGRRGAQRGTSGNRPLGPLRLLASPDFGPARCVRRATQGSGRPPRAFFGSTTSVRWTIRSLPIASTSASFRSCGGRARDGTGSGGASGVGRENADGETSGVSHFEGSSYGKRGRRRRRCRRQGRDRRGGQAVLLRKRFMRLHRRRDGARSALNETVQCGRARADLAVAAAPLAWLAVASPPRPTLSRQPGPCWLSPPWRHWPPATGESSEQDL